MEPYGNLLLTAPPLNGIPATLCMVLVVGVIILEKEWVVTYVTQANAVNDVSAVLADIGA